MKKVITAILIILISSNAFAITIQEGQVISKYDCLIMLDRIQGNKAVFQITLPCMARERFIMKSGERRAFESDNKEFFFDVLKLSEDKATVSISEKK